MCLCLCWPQGRLAGPREARPGDHRELAQGSGEGFFSFFVWSRASTVTAWRTPDCLPTAGSGGGTSQLLLWEAFSFQPAQADCTSGHIPQVAGRGGSLKASDLEVV